MQAYKEFSPTQLDTKGAFLDDQQDWIVAPCGLSRDSGCLEQSNWSASIKILGGESDTLKIRRFGHWACGWFEIILVHPSRKAEIEGLEQDLEDYPVLDDDDFSEREHQAKNEYWGLFSLQERIDLCREAGISIFQARRNYIPSDVGGYVEV